MHPRTLARDGCSGGSCPAVYDSDPDLKPDELAIVGKKAGDGLSGRLADQVAPDEAAVIINRDLVAEALWPSELVSAADFDAQFSAFSYTAFRLETLQVYAGTARDEEWIGLLKANRRWGKSHQRVHVVTEPLTPAMEQELTEGYAGNVAAGEDIRVISVPGDDEWPHDVPRSDFWLFDSSTAYRMLYEPDGEWSGARRITGPAYVLKACRARDAALHRAVPWSAYIAEHPHLRRLVAQ